MKNNTPDKLHPDGELLRSPSRRFRETVVFIHHFGGKKESTHRHQQMLLDAGYDCVRFNLYYNSSIASQRISKQIVFLLKHLLSGKSTFVFQWINELEEILNQVPGPKILYSLSSPSSSVVGAVGFKKRKDIKAWVCDCGPFLEVWKCFWNYTRLQAKVTSPLAAFAFNVLGFSLFGGLGYRRRMKKWLLNFPPDFPILSLRSGQDRLVPERAIQEFFSLSDGLHIQIQCFNSAGHVDAIKTDPQSYIPAVLTFLQKHSSLLESSKE